MAKNPQYSRRHYEDVARIMSDMAKKHGSADGTHVPTLWMDTREAFSELFAKDNPKFDRYRFEDACAK